MIGKSIGDAADSVSRNGMGKTIRGWILVVVGSILFVLIPSFVKHRQNMARDKSKHDNDMKRDKSKHAQKMELENKRFNNKLRLQEIRSTRKKRDLIIDPESISSQEDSDFSVTPFDELISGEPVDNKSQRLGLRCFHLGMDCGFIGQTNVGKTTFVFQYAMCLAKGEQIEGVHLSPDWHLEPKITVLYFAFEQTANYFKMKYPQQYVNNLFVDVESAGDFIAIKSKIEKKQKEAADRRLVVVFDNITKMQDVKSEHKRDFFDWLEKFRVDCDKQGRPITYIKVFHTRGSYKIYEPIDTSTIYGPKTASCFAQDMVGFGICKDPDGSKRYLKELKNKTEEQKLTVSVYRYADTESPFYGYEGEEEEASVLPTRAEVRKGRQTSREDLDPAVQIPKKRGPKEKYDYTLCKDICEELTAGFSWREILEGHNIEYDRKSKDGFKNKVKGLRQALRKYNLCYDRD